MPIYYNITMGGWSLGTPNLYYVIYGRPLIPLTVIFSVDDGFDNIMMITTFTDGGTKTEVHKGCIIVGVHSLTACLIFCIDLVPV